MLSLVLTACPGLQAGPARLATTPAARSAPALMQMGMLAPSGYSERYSDRYDRMDRYGNGFQNDRDGYGRNYNYGGRRGYSMDRYDDRNGMGRGYGYRGMGRMGGGPAWVEAPSSLL